MSPKSEHRRFGRRTVRQLAWIVVPGRPRLSCAVTNFSRARAYLELEPPKWLPFRFEIVMDGADLSHMCEIRQTSRTGICVDIAECGIERCSRVLPPSAISDFDEWAGVPDKSGAPGPTARTARRS